MILKKYDLCNEDFEHFIQKAKDLQFWDIADIISDYKK
jgi:hypothetical protein